MTLIELIEKIKLSNIDKNTKILCIDQDGFEYELEDILLDNQCILNIKYL